MLTTDLLPETGQKTRSDSRGVTGGADERTRESSLTGRPSDRAVLLTPVLCFFKSYAEKECVMSDCLIAFFLKFILILCMAILTTYMYMHHIYIWCLKRPGKDVRSGPGVIDKDVGWILGTKLRFSEGIASAGGH